jgi:HemY protein
MTAYRWLLGLLAVALAAALLAWAVGNDPGYVLVERGTWRIETTAVFAAGVFIALAVIVPAAWWLLRWPLVAWSRRTRRRAREKLAQGMLALAEGRPARAGNLLHAAGRLPSLKQPALIAAVLAARQRGDTAAHGELLQKLATTEGGDVAAAVLRAEAELDDGRAGVAIELLDALDQAQRLPPAGVRVLITALARRGRARESLAMLARLKKTQVMPPAALERFEAGILADALTQATDAINLTSLWADLSRQQRRQPDVVVAFARRGAELAIGGEIHDEIESVLEKSFSDAAVDAWARLPGVDPRAKLARAEGWLVRHPNSVALLLAAGRLYRDTGQAARAEGHFKRAVSAGGGAVAWEEIAQLHQAEGDTRAALDAYANALAARRSASSPAQPTPAPALPAPEASVVPELRNEHGVPMLPAPARTNDAA